MTSTVLETIIGQRDECRAAAIAIAESEEFNPEDATFVELQARAEHLDRQVASLSSLMDKREADNALAGRMAKAAKRREAENGNGREVERRETLGEVFIRSDVFTGYPGRGTSPRMEVVEERALPMTLAGWSAVLPAGPQIDLTAPNVPPLIIPLCSQITVTTNSVEYITYSKTAGGADIVAEGGQKPPVEWAPVVTPAALDNIAGYTQLTRQLLEDAPAVRSFIDGELRREVLVKAEAEAVAAITAATLPTAMGPNGAGMVGAVRAGMAEVQAAGYSPNAFLVSSDDLVEMDIAVMNTAGTGPNRTAAYWGLTPVVDPNATPGTVTVGDFVAGVQHYTRSGVSLYITDSHSDTFLKNVFTLLAEQRSKTVVVRPAALCEAIENPTP